MTIILKAGGMILRPILSQNQSKTLKLIKTIIWMSQPVLRLGLIYLLSDNVKKEVCVFNWERKG